MLRHNSKGVVTGKFLIGNKASSLPHTEEGLCEVMDVAHSQGRKKPRALCPSGN